MTTSNNPRALRRCCSVGRPSHNGFTLVELLVVIGIIAVLIGILLPTLSRVQRQSKSTACRANLRQNYMFLLMYANENRGVLFPQGRGSGQPREERWPTLVFKPRAWDPPTMICPADENPGERHSYIVNNHFDRYQIRFGQTKGVSASDIILMGEKRSEELDYYMDLSDFDRVVEEYRHGFYLGSNYLFLDGHVDSRLPSQVRIGVDPWEPAVTKPTQPPPPPPTMP